MKNSRTIMAVAAIMMTPATTIAQTPAHHVYHGHDRNYYRHCHRSKGTTGLLAGAGVGGLGAAALGAGPVGLAAGVIGGGLLGRHIDKRRNAAHNREKGC